MIDDRKIVQKLHEIQHRERFLSRDAMVELAEEIGVKLRDLHQVASFFPHFRLSEPPIAEVQVCRDMACHFNGAKALTEDLEHRFAKVAPGRVHVEGASCLGQCDRAPAIRVNDRDCSLRDPAKIVELVQAQIPELTAALAKIKDAREKVRAIDAQQTASARSKKIREDAQVAIKGARESIKTSLDRIPTHGPSTDPTQWVIDPYHGRPTYQVLRDRAQNFDGKAVLATLETAGLIGLGGPGQRTGKKWAEVRDAPGAIKYVVCNGDESEPGTFKDRELLLNAPHLIVEGMTIGAAVVGATQGYVYIRHEYEKPIESMRAAIRHAYAEGVLGRPSKITGKRFDLEVFVSPGGYICGEQTALIEAIEGHRGEPRNRPPELQVKGLHGQPTLLNNIETFSWVPFILNDNGAAFLADGVNGGKGRRFFSISGDVRNPGVFEVPIGTTFGDLIEMAGGLPRGLKALATSGPSGGFLPRMLPISKINGKFRGRMANRPIVTGLAADATEIDVLTIELDIGVFRTLNPDARAILDKYDGGVAMMLGAGIIVYGEGRDMVDQAVNCGRFYQAESCGKCVPCREGTQRIVEISERLDKKRGDAQAMADGAKLASDLRSAMTQASICGLGQVAANPLLTALNFFQADFAQSSPSEDRARG